MTLFGLYVPGGSWLHRLGAGWKYLALLLLTIPALALAQVPVSLVALVVTMILLVSAGIRPRRAWALPLAFWVLAAALAAYQVLVGRLDLAFVVVTNLLTAVYASRVLTMTTPGPVLIDALVSGLRWLTRVGIDPELVGLAIAVMLRSVPVLLDSFTQVRQAARARGQERNLILLVTPVVVRAVGHAQETGAALLARGLGEDVRVGA
jgi:biotin transport system permease protein